MGKSDPTAGPCPTSRATAKRGAPGSADESATRGIRVVHVTALWHAGTLARDESDGAVPATIGPTLPHSSGTVQADEPADDAQRIGGRRGSCRRRRAQRSGAHVEGTPGTGSTFALSEVATRLLEPKSHAASPDPAAAADGFGAPRVIIDDGHVLRSTSSVVLRALRDLQDLEFPAITPIVDATFVPAPVLGHGVLWTTETTRDKDDPGSRGSR